MRSEPVGPEAGSGASLFCSEGVQHPGIGAGLGPNGLPDAQQRALESGFGGSSPGASAALELLTDREGPRSPGAEGRRETTQTVKRLKTTQSKKISSNNYWFLTLVRKKCFIRDMMSVCLFCVHYLLVFCHYATPKVITSIYLAGNSFILLPSGLSQGETGGEGQPGPSPLLGEGPEELGWLEVKIRTAKRLLCISNNNPLQPSISWGVKM